jgi:hypothetical protein
MAQPLVLHPGVVVVGDAGDNAHGVFGCWYWVIVERRAGARRGVE